MDTEAASIIDDISSMTTSNSVITGFGQQLRKAREAMHLTEKEAAARLYLNANIISIIETEAFMDGPPATFMRGYVRTYARMLNFSENDIQSSMDKLNLAVPLNRPFTPILHATAASRNERFIRWISYLIIITLIALVAIWWQSHSKYAIADIPAASQSDTANQSPLKTHEQTTVPASEQTTSAALSKESVTTPSQEASQAVASDNSSLAATEATPLTPEKPIDQPPLLAASQPVAAPVIAESSPPLPNVSAPLQTVKPAVLSKKSPTATSRAPASQKQKSAISDMALALPEPE